MLWNSQRKEMSLLRNGVCEANEWRNWDNLSAADATEAGMSGRTKRGFLEAAAAEEEDDDGDALRKGTKLVEESSIEKFGAKDFGVSVAEVEADSPIAIVERWWWRGARWQSWTRYSVGSGETEYFG